MEKTGQVNQEEHHSLSNPADRPLVTLDTNVVIALRNNEADAQPARQLLALNRAGAVTLNVTLSTALEEQRPGENLEMHEYAAWLQEQGIALGNAFTGPRTIGFHVPGTPSTTTTFDVRLEIALNERIHTILFPNISFSWVRYRDQEYERRGIVGIKRMALIELESARWDIYIPPSPLAPAQRPTPALDTVAQAEREELWALCEQLHRTWMNAKNDALGLYAHLTQAAHTTHPEWAIFVTNDGNFRKQTKLAALRKLGFPGEILRPTEAVAFLARLTGIPLPVL